MKLTARPIGAIRLGAGYVLVALSCVCVMMTFLGCAAVDIEMRQTVQATPSQSQGGGGNRGRDNNGPTLNYFGSLELHDLDLAAWSLFNNTFIDAGVEPGDVQFGVLIQLGEYIGADMVDVFKHIDIDGHLYCIPDTGSDSEVCEDPDNMIEWINIVPAGVDPDTIMTSGDVKYLYPKDNTDTKCSEFYDECLRSLDLDPPVPECLADVTANESGTSNCYECSRRRSLHATFKPKAVITYWFGTHGTDISLGGGHSTQIFRFPDEVDVYVDGVEQTSHSLIQVTALDRPTHASHHDPPMNR